MNKLKNLLTNTHKFDFPWTALIMGIILGGLIASSLLWHQIENRKTIAYNYGYLEGSLNMAYFLQDHLNGKAVNTYNIKYFGITPIETDGVRTFKVIGLEE